MADDGLARAIDPSHTHRRRRHRVRAGHRPLGRPDERRPIIGALAAEVLAEAIVRAARRRRTPLGGLPAARDLGTVRRPRVPVSLHLAVHREPPPHPAHRLLRRRRRPRHLDGALRPHAAAQFFVAGRSLGPGPDLLVDAGGQHRRRVARSAPPGSRIATGSARGGGSARRASARWSSRSSSRRGCGRWPRSTTSTRPATTSSSATGRRCAAWRRALVGDRLAGAAGRPADRRRHDPQRPHRHAALGRRAHRRRDHDDLLHGRRPAGHRRGSTRCSWS